MTEQEALNVLNDVASKFQGTRKDHEILVTAVDKLQRLLDVISGKPELSEL